jgi:hypothetical protein
MQPYTFAQSWQHGTIEDRYLLLHLCPNKVTYKDKMELFLSTPINRINIYGNSIVGPTNYVFDGLPHEYLNINNTTDEWISIEYIVRMLYQHNFTKYSSCIKILIRGRYDEFRRLVRQYISDKNGFIMELFLVSCNVEWDDEYMIWLINKLPLQFVKGEVWKWGKSYASKIESYII